MRKFTRVDFIEMPWNNGGGTTCELFKLQNPFVFRLSVATVNSDGPFSLFPLIDRTLILLEGNGFKLNNKALHRKFEPIYFYGEDKIHCELIEGKNLDFNIMVDRRWGKTTTHIIHRNSDVTLSADNRHKFIFDYDTFELWEIVHNDQLNFLACNTPLIVVEVYEN